MVVPKGWAWIEAQSGLKKTPHPISKTWIDLDMYGREGTLDAYEPVLCFVWLDNLFLILILPMFGAKYVGVQYVPVWQKPPHIKRH